MTEKRNQREIGSIYEKQVGEYLAARGYEIIEYNFRCCIGEIDLIAKDGEFLVFVEVKYRRNENAGNPLEAVTLRKQRTIGKVAAYYLMTHGYGEDAPCRFDVAAVLGNRVQIVQNAFEYQGD